MVEMTDEKLLKRVASTVEELESILGSIVINDTAILDALAQLLNTLHQQQLKTEESHRSSADQIGGEIRSLTTALVDSGLKLKGRDPILVAADVDDQSGQNPELGLLEYLYSFLPNSKAIDIGANVGNFAQRLLAAGYEVYAFEPYPPVFEQLEKIKDDKNFSDKFHPFQLAIGSTDTSMDLQVAANNSGAKWDTTLFNSLVKHPMLTDCTFKESIPVKVRSLESLVKEGKIPDSGGLLKIDSEGFDLDIVKGLGKSKFSVVMAEFWDADHPFGRSGHGNLNELVTELKSRGYGWHIVIYHCDQTATVSYYCNRRNTVRGSWGNAIFFNEYELFAKALRWCEDVLAPTLYR